MTIDPDDIGPWQSNRDVADDATLRGWLEEAPGTLRELPWEADPNSMSELAVFDSSGLPVEVGNPCAGGIVFGGQTDANFSRVSNWVQVDDLGGLGALYCGSFGGKFYLRATVPPSSGEEADIAKAEAGEEVGMTPAFECIEDGGLPLINGMAPLPRAACPLAQREALLKVNDRWRSDLWWDTLINGCLCHQPPECANEPDWSNPFRYFTLRLVQVGRWLCFHTSISRPAITNITRSDTGWITAYEVENSQYYDIGYSSAWHGMPRINYGAWFYYGFPETEGTAEPPWGKNLSNSWQGDDSTSPAAATGEVSGRCGVIIGEDGLSSTSVTGGYPYCRVYPRINASAGWRLYNGILSPDDWAGSGQEEMTDLLFGLSPEWVEERLGISDPFSRGSVTWTPADAPDFSCYRGVTPAGNFSLVFDANLPLPENGQVYLAFYAATIDNCLLTASICAPYGYRGVS